ncbi:MAG: glycosyltransferase [Micromonosporaceae bacterium]|nr:glycosyltransferase [Micromonosporaceae bacterium]
MLRVVIMSGSVGAGHDGAAEELARRVRERGHEVVRLDLLDLVAWRIGWLVRRCYAAELARVPRTWGWVLTTLQRHRWLAALVGFLVYRLAAPATQAALTPCPDLVVSVYPGASQLLGRMRSRGELDAPVVTFLTDMSVHPLWISPGVDLHLALHEVAAAQAGEAGAETVRVGGAAVRPRFRPAYASVERAVVRSRLGIPADRPAALITGGCWGLGDLLATAADIAATGLATPVVVCGTNTQLQAIVRARGLGVAVGWIDDLAPLMRACDVVVQNAGGLTSLEALACGVPVLSYRCLPGHGTSNAAALHEAGLAAWPTDLGALRAALIKALEGPPPAVPELVLADPTELLVGVCPGTAAAATRDRDVAPVPAPREVDPVTPATARDIDAAAAEAAGAAGVPA